MPLDKPPGLTSKDDPYFMQVTMELPRDWIEQMLEPMLDSGGLLPFSPGCLTADLGPCNEFNAPQTAAAIFAMGLMIYYYEPLDAMRLLAYTSLELAAKRAPDADVSLDIGTLPNSVYKQT